MKNIFILTRAEQRAVIIIMMVLLAATIGKRFLEDRSHVPTATSTSSQALPRATPSPTEENAAPDDRP